MRRTSWAFEVAVLGVDIRNGRRDMARGCPVALAVKRAVEDYAAIENVLVCVDAWRIEVVCGMGHYSAPRLDEGDQEWARFVRAFDGKKAVDPFRFWLQLDRRPRPIQLPYLNKRQGDQTNGTDRRD